MLLLEAPYPITIIAAQNHALSVLRLAGDCNEVFKIGPFSWGPGFPKALSLGVAFLSVTQSSLHYASAFSLICAGTVTGVSRLCWKPVDMTVSVLRF